LFGLGSLILSLSFVLYLLAAGHYFLHKSDIKYILSSELNTEVLDEDIGRSLVMEKCNRCHTLGRVFKTFKSKEGWTRTVNVMAKMDLPNIKDFEAKQIVFFLLRHQERRKAIKEKEVAKEISKSLLKEKCTICHDLERIFKAKKSKEEWLITVKRMTDFNDDPQFLSESEKNDIIDYLANE